MHHLRFLRLDRKGRGRSVWMGWSLAVLFVVGLMILGRNIELSFRRDLNLDGSLGASFRYTYNDYMEDLSERGRSLHNTASWLDEKGEFYNDPRKHIPSLSDVNSTELRRVVVGIFSSVSRQSKRNIARSTWMKDIPLALKLYNVEVQPRFIIGNLEDYTASDQEVLRAEHKQYGDLVFTDTPDVYKKMGFKVYDWFKMIVAEQSALPRSRKANFVMKLDDDSYLNVENFARVMQTVPLTRLRYGFIWYEARQNSKSKYFDKLYHLGEYFPPYAAGPGHVLSIDLLHEIMDIRHPLMIQNDDVNVDLWLYSFDILRLHDARWLGNYNLCCGKNRKTKTDFLVIVNARVEEFVPIRQFLHDDRLEDWNIEFDFWACECSEKMFSLSFSWVLLLVVAVGLGVYYASSLNLRGQLTYEDRP